jgi:hypothetical protein
MEIYDGTSYNDYMKVTTLIPDQLVHEVQGLAGGKNLTESLIKALTEWSAQQRIHQLNERVAARPLKFSPGFSAGRVRALNRKA